MDLAIAKNESNPILEVANQIVPEKNSVPSQTYLTYEQAAQLVFDNLRWTGGHFGKYYNLIELIRERPQIWDVEQFRKRNDWSISQAWDQIILALSPQNYNYAEYSEFLKQKIRSLLKRRWYTLKSRWTLCHKQTMMFCGQHVGGPLNLTKRPKQFHYYVQMSFLKKLSSSIVNTPVTSTPLKFNENLFNYPPTTFVPERLISEDFANHGESSSSSMKRLSKHFDLDIPNPTNNQPTESKKLKSCSSEISQNIGDGKDRVQIYNLKLLLDNQISDNSTKAEPDSSGYDSTK